MPILRAIYGLGRHEALQLPHWEFQQLVVAYSQQQARETLSLYQAVGMAFGGKQKDVRQYVDSLRRASGHKEKKTSKPGSVFASLSGLGSVEDYKRAATEQVY